VTEGNELLGPFALGAKIGGGGMASVYLGKYVAAPGETAPPGQETVALKVIKGDFVKDARYEEMFLDEANILTQLSHPNVIRTVGYGAQAGAWFIAMELLMGRSLLDIWEAALQAKRTLPLDLAAFVAAEVARGLEHAHTLVDEEDKSKLAIVHRDVNPSNVFIGYDGSVKLIDFGLAKARKRQTKSTKGLIKGKIPYLSPEQITEATLDGRSDVYALGTTLWEAATMRRLFKRDTDVATVRAIQKGEVPDPRTFVEGFPEALWRIIERSLAQDRDRRYPSAGAMANDLDMFLGNARLASLKRRLAHLIEELFPGEAEKQSTWLAEATGQTVKTFAPDVPLAQVPAAEASTPAIFPDTDSESETETESESESGTATESAADTVTESATDTATESAADTVMESATDAESDHSPEPPAVTATRQTLVFVLVGALAGLVVVVAWIAFMR
jgi:eukaryotic-like serine/threonine-protein kinase